MVFSSQRPVILLILSYTLTTKFALKLLRHDKHVQTEKGHTFQQRIRGVGAEVQTRQYGAPPSGPYRNMNIFILQSKFPNSQNLSLKKVKP